MGVESLFSEPTQTHTKTTIETFHNPPDCVGFPGGSAEKNLPASAGDLCSIPWVGKISGEGDGNPLQYSCLENPRDKEA